MEIKKIEKLFENRPIDEYTRIVNVKYYELNDIHICIEYWNWEGIYGSSIIFLSKEIENLSDNELIAIFMKVTKSGLSNATFKREGSFTFVNGNFFISD